MKITNNHGLPESFVAFAEDDKYSAGAADISVTSLIDSPRVRLLRRENASSAEVDVVDMVWALFGTAVHHVLESSSDGVGVIQEERLFTDINGWVVSGAIDHQEVIDGKVQITDYKVTGAYSVIFGKQEWELQQNCYAHLVRQAKGMEVSAVRVCAIIRDWNRRKAMSDPNYPQVPVVIINLPLWTADKAREYMEERVAIHQSADVSHDDLGITPLCSDGERWLRDEKWAVMKNKNKRATKLFDNNEDAIEFAKQDAAYWVKYRPGENVRCDGDYCNVSAICSQYQEMKTMEATDDRDD